MDDATLLARFEDATLPADAFGHREHVRVAWLCLRAAPFEDAAARLCAALRRFAAANGKPERFHATITWAYLALVDERMHATSASTFAELEAAAPELFDGSALRALYDEGTLASPLARRAFVLPRRSEATGHAR
jgi:hypothetical protein